MAAGCEGEDLTKCLMGLHTHSQNSPSALSDGNPYYQHLTPVGYFPGHRPPPPVVSVSPMEALQRGLRSTSLHQDIGLAVNVKPQVTSDEEDHGTKVDDEVETEGGCARTSIVYCSSSQVETNAYNEEEHQPNSDGGKGDTEGVEPRQENREDGHAQEIERGSGSSALTETVSNSSSEPVGDELRSCLAHLESLSSTSTSQQDTSLDQCIAPAEKSLQLSPVSSDQRQTAMKTKQKRTAGTTQKRRGRPPKTQKRRGRPPKSAQDSAKPQRPAKPRGKSTSRLARKGRDKTASSTCLSPTGLVICSADREGMVVVRKPDISRTQSHSPHVVITMEAMEESEELKKGSGEEEVLEEPKGRSEEGSNEKRNEIEPDTRVAKSVNNEIEGEKEVMESDVTMDDTLTETSVEMYAVSDTQLASVGKQQDCTASQTNTAAVSDLSTGDNLKQKDREKVAEEVKKGEEVEEEKERGTEKVLASSEEMECEQSDDVPMEASVDVFAISDTQLAVANRLHDCTASHTNTAAASDLSTGDNLKQKDREKVAEEVKKGEEENEKETEKNSVPPGKPAEEMECEQSNDVPMEDSVDVFAISDTQLAVTNRLQGFTASRTNTAAVSDLSTGDNLKQKDREKVAEEVKKGEEEEEEETEKNSVPAGKPDEEMKCEQSDDVPMEDSVNVFAISDTQLAITNRLHDCIASHTNTAADGGGGGTSAQDKQTQNNENKEKDEDMEVDVSKDGSSNESSVRTLGNAPASLPPPQPSLITPPTPSPSPPQPPSPSPPSSHNSRNSPQSTNRPSYKDSEINVYPIDDTQRNYLDSHKGWKLNPSIGFIRLDTQLVVTAHHMTRAQPIPPTVNKAWIYNLMFNRNGTYSFEVSAIKGIELTSQEQDHLLPVVEITPYETSAEEDGNALDQCDVPKPSVASDSVDKVTSQASNLSETRTQSSPVRHLHQCESSSENETERAQGPSAFVVVEESQDLVSASDSCDQELLTLADNAKDHLRTAHVQTSDEEIERANNLVRHQLLPGEKPRKRARFDKDSLSNKESQLTRTEDSELYYQNSLTPYQHTSQAKQDKERVERTSVSQSVPSLRTAQPQRRGQARLASRLPFPPVSAKVASIIQGYWYLRTKKRTKHLQ